MSSDGEDYKCANYSEVQRLNSELDKYVQQFWMYKRAGPAWIRYEHFAYSQVQSLNEALAQAQAACANDERMFWERFNSAKQQLQQEEAEEKRRLEEFRKTEKARITAQVEQEKKEEEQAKIDNQNEAAAMDQYKNDRSTAWGSELEANKVKVQEHFKALLQTVKKKLAERIVFIRQKYQFNLVNEQIKIDKSFANALNTMEQGVQNRKNEILSYIAQINHEIEKIKNGTSEFYANENYRKEFLMNAKKINLNKALFSKAGKIIFLEGAKEEVQKPVDPVKEEQVVVEDSVMGSSFSFNVPGIF